MSLCVQVALSHYQQVTALQPKTFDKLLSQVSEGREQNVHTEILGNNSNLNCLNTQGLCMTNSVSC